MLLGELIEYVLSASKIAELNREFYNLEDQEGFFNRT